MLQMKSFGSTVSIICMDKVRNEVVHKWVGMHSGLKRGVLVGSLEKNEGECTVGSDARAVMTSEVSVDARWEV